MIDQVVVERPCPVFCLAWVPSKDDPMDSLVVSHSLTHCQHYQSSTNHTYTLGQHDKPPGAQVASPPCSLSLSVMPGGLVGPDALVLPEQRHEPEQGPQATRM